MHFHVRRGEVATGAMWPYASEDAGKCILVSGPTGIEVAWCLRERTVNLFTALPSLPYINKGPKALAVPADMLSTVQPFQPLHQRCRSPALPGTYRKTRAFFDLNSTLCGYAARPPCAEWTGAVAFLMVTWGRTNYGNAAVDCITRLEQILRVHCRRPQGACGPRSSALVVVPCLSTLVLCVSATSKVRQS